jgi:hypothetical protein
MLTRQQIIEAMTPPPGQSEAVAQEFARLTGRPLAEARERAERAWCRRLDEALRSDLRNLLMGDQDPVYQALERESSLRRGEQMAEEQGDRWRRGKDPSLQHLLTR